MKARRAFFNIIQTGFMENREHSSWIRKDLNGKGFITAELHAGGEKNAGTSPPGETQFKRTFGQCLACETKASIKKWR